MISNTSNIAKMRSVMKRFNLDREAAKIVNTDKRFPQILRDQMRLTEGIDKWEYSNSEYRQYKRNLSSYIGQFPLIDFYNTGKFQKGIFARASGTKFTFSSRDSKRDELTEIYGENIWVLADPTLVIARRMVQSQLVINLKAKFKAI